MPQRHIILLPDYADCFQDVVIGGLEATVLRHVTVREMCIVIASMVVVVGDVTMGGLQLIVRLVCMFCVCSTM